MRSILILLEENMLLQNQFNAVSQQLNQEAEGLREDLNKKEQALSKQQQLVKKLQSENAKYKKLEKQNKIAAVNENNEVKTTTTNERAAKSTVDENYRTARLRSLSATMLNRKSSDRKNILVYLPEP